MLTDVLLFIYSIFCVLECKISTYFVDNMNDFADTFHTMNLNVVNGFWALEKKIALRSHFPPINWLTSWTRDDEKLEKFHTELHPEFPAFQKTFKNILSQEEKLNQKIQLFGENSIGERDRWTLKIAQLIRNDFLQQNMFSSYDRYCPVFKMVWMMRNIVSYYNLGIEALEQFENLKVFFSPFIHFLFFFFEKFRFWKFL